MNSFRIVLVHQKLERAKRNMFDSPESKAFEGCTPHESIRNPPTTYTHEKDSRTHRKKKKHKEK